MIYFNILLLIMIFLLGYQVFILKKNIKQNETLDGGIILTKLKEKPVFSEADENNQILKDIFESIKIENWNIKIEKGVSLTGGEYTVEFENHAGDLSFKTTLRWYSDKVAKLGYTKIRVDNKNIKYDIEEGDESYQLIVNFIWEQIKQKSENEYDENISYYKHVIENIKPKLKTLNRDRILKKILK